METMIAMRDLSEQRHADVSVPPGSETVADVLAEAVQSLNLPVVSQRGLNLEYTVRTADGSLLRPSESLRDERVQDLLTAGECTLLPRLTAAGGK